MIEIKFGKGTWTLKQVEKETETNQPINHDEKRLYSAKVAGHLC